MADEWPILFSAEMAARLPGGAKTATRRVLVPQPAGDEVVAEAAGTWVWTDGSGVHDRRRCPYGVPGDLLYVREPTRLERDGTKLFARYRADDSRNLLTMAQTLAARSWSVKAKWTTIGGRTHTPWRPGIHVPKALSRRWLRVLAIRAERLQRITANDAQDEGMEPHDRKSPVEVFRGVWDSINARRGFGWTANPWTWVISFQLVESRVRESSD